MPKIMKKGLMPGIKAGTSSIKLLQMAPFPPWGTERDVGRGRTDPTCDVAIFIEREYIAKILVDPDGKGLCVVTNGVVVTEAVIHPVALESLRSQRNKGVGAASQSPIPGC